MTIHKDMFDKKAKNEPDYHDDLGPSIEATEQIVNHLQMIDEVLAGPACWAFGAGGEDERRQIENLKSSLTYWRKQLDYLKSD